MAPNEVAINGQQGCVLVHLSSGVIFGGLSNAFCRLGGNTVFPPHMQSPIHFTRNKVLMLLVPTLKHTKWVRISQLRRLATARNIKSDDVAGVSARQQ
jgi:hypothetical protein